MKTSRKSIRQIAAGLMVAALAVGFSAFKESNTDPLSYHYKESSMTLTELHDINNWEVTSNPDCASGAELPCVIEFEPTSTEPDFQTYLNSRNLNELIDDAVATKGN